jgi:hypothetical protein
LPSSTDSTIATSNIQPSIVYEDNNACIVLVTTESNFKPRNNHISIKYHHFHDQIKNGNLQILKVSSEANWADIFIEPLGKVKFQRLCNLLMGW